MKKISYLIFICLVFSMNVYAENIKPKIKVIESSIDRITVKITNGRNNKYDWVGVYKINDDNTKYISWAYTNSMKDGNLIFDPELMTKGTYEIRLFPNDRYTLLAKGIFHVSHEAKIKVIESSIDRITVNITNGRSNKNDWIGVYKIDNNNNRYISWVYTNGMKNGNLILDPKVMTQGTYEIRLFPNDQYTLLAKNIFHIGYKSKSKIKVVKSSADSITVNIKNGRSSKYDWIGIYRVNGKKNKYTSWVYTNGIENGEITFDPKIMSEGTYEVRLIRNNKYLLLARDTFIVSHRDKSKIKIVKSSMNDIIINVRDGLRHKNDWVGVYNINDTNYKYITWVNIPKNGFFNIDPKIEKEGIYEVRLFSNARYILLDKAIFIIGEKPVIVLNGNKEIVIQQGGNYNEGGAIAIDRKDGELTNVVINNNNINTSIQGKYSITYNIQDLDGNNANEIIRNVNVISKEKNYKKLTEKYNKYIGAYQLIVSSSASLLSKHRKNLNLSSNNIIDIISQYSYMFINKSILWNKLKDGSFLWQPGYLKELPEYKYAGKIDGKYQVIPTAIKCKNSTTNDPDCNLQEAIVDGIGMDVSHYLAKWPVFYEAMKDASDIGSSMYNYYNEISKNNASQIKNSVAHLINEKYAMTNYMDGTNGVYRWNYAQRGKDWGYNSYSFSHVFSYSSIGFSDSKFIDSIYINILKNISSFQDINLISKEELLLLLSPKYNQANPVLNCIDINNYDGCKEKYIFKNKIIPILELSFINGQSIDQDYYENSMSSSYQKIVGPHVMIMKYAFKHNITEWKEEYYKFFKKFVNEVVMTDAKHYNNLDGNPDVLWHNLNIYSELHFMLWASMFLQLSSQYDRDYINYNDYDIETETKLRNFIEKYITDIYKARKNNMDFLLK